MKLNTVSVMSLQGISSCQGLSFKDTLFDSHFTPSWSFFSDKYRLSAPTFQVTNKEKVMNRELSGDILSLVKCLNPTPCGIESRE